MFGTRRKKQIDEHEAAGKTEEIYHDVKQTLRVSGVNMNFRAWARFEKFFPEMWKAIRPNAETRAFEEAADRIRSESVDAALGLGRLDTADRAQLGESQSYQVRAALELYHYITPKLLLLTAAVRLALRGEVIGGKKSGGEVVELIERGIPPGMCPMEMVPEDTRDERARALFDDFTRTLALSSPTSYFRALALWPDYLTIAWGQLKPLTKSEDYHKASAGLRATARALARSLPYPISLSPAHADDLDEDGILQVTEMFEQLLPPSTITLALFRLDWHPPEIVARSPFPARPRFATRMEGEAK